MKKYKAQLSVLALIMINVVAIGSIRGIPLSATYGLSSLFYYIIFGILFFIPSAIVSAELATGWPQTGGVYVWIREAFGAPIAFTVVWIQWIYNICWYPTILSLLAATLAYIINPKLAGNAWYMLSVVFITYWLITAITLRGIHISGILSTITAIVGALVPMAFIIILGGIWLWQGKPSCMELSASAFLPHISKPEDWVFLIGIVYSLVGMEMSATHAQEVKNPQRDYPRALYYSTIIILISLALATLATAIVVPGKQLELHLVTGLLDAFNLFLKAFNLVWLSPIIGIFIIVGIIGGVGAWMIGPSRGLLVAAQDGCVPKVLQKINAKQMPVVILIVQGIIFSLISLVILVMPTVNSSFLILSELTCQLAVSCYVFIFAAAIRLRYKYPHIKRAYKVPFGNVGMWVICIVGILVSLFVVVIGFIPPSSIAVNNIKFYESFLIIGFVGFYLLPLIIYKMCKR
jgi:glutamate:GABA antiporter